MRFIALNLVSGERDVLWDLTPEGEQIFISSFQVLAGLMSVQLVTYLNFDVYIDPQERLYMQYSEKLSGPADQEKDDFIAEETERFADLYTQMDAYFRAFSSGQINQEAYEALCSGIQRQLEGEEAFVRARNQYEQMKTLGYDYVCQTGYERLLGPSGQHDAIVLTIKLLIVLILGLASVHSIETESNMVLLLNSVPGNQKSLRMKSIVVSVYAIAAAMITFAPHIVSTIKAYGLPGMLANGNSVPLLRMGTQTVLGGLCIYAAIIIGLAILAAHVISLISKKAENIAGTIIVSSVLLLIPASLLVVV